MTDNGQLAQKRVKMTVANASGNTAGARPGYTYRGLGYVLRHRQGSRSQDQDSRVLLIGNIIQRANAND